MSALIIDQLTANRTLTTLRDTLLPKRLRGALGVDELAGSVLTGR